jgi:hypothetical protein
MPAEAITSPAGEKATAVTASWWALKVEPGAPVAASHSRTVPSPRPEATKSPAGGEGHRPDPGM